MPQAPIDPRWPKILSLSVHEFRTPMTVVAGYIRMLLKDRAGPLNDQQRKLLEEAEKSCGRLSALLTEVSDLSSLESGTAPINKQTIDLRAAVRAAVAQLPPLPDRDVAVHLELGSEPVPITGDPVRLTQAIGSVVAALRRELIGEHGLTVREIRAQGTYELLIGDAETIAALETEPASAREIFDEWRGGVGLSLAVARRVLNVHDAHLHGAPGGTRAGGRILFRSV
jgi:K+-sensing histidine kinase KdpD